MAGRLLYFGVVRLGAEMLVCNVGRRPCFSVWRGATCCPFNARPDGGPVGCSGQVRVDGGTARKCRPAPEQPIYAAVPDEPMPGSHLRHRSGRRGGRSELGGEILPALCTSRPASGASFCVSCAARMCTRHDRWAVGARKPLGMAKPVRLQKPVSVLEERPEAGTSDYVV